MIRAGSLSEAIEKICGEGIRVSGRRPVFGGDINRAYALEFPDGKKLFMKANTRHL